mmetsp:Transcript_45811/g.83985  ORF Transcript_45811/g.83985 Transcript_45811/m.83985 type:complete len:589 (-) Transcript_45811:206-1972(-)
MSDFGADLEKIGYVGKFLKSKAAILPRTRLEGAKAKLIPRHRNSGFLFKHYEMLAELGEGSFGSVRLIRDRETGSERVCKIVDIRGLPVEAAELAKNEVAVLATVDHPHIVRLYEYADDTNLNQLFMVLEHVSGGDCLDMLQRSNGTLDEALVARLVHQVLAAIAYLHSRDIVHRDIKPENMMLSRSAPWKRWNCKLIDFGVARQMERSTDSLGTAPYVAPEVLTGTGTHTLKADMWSLGCTTVELLCGRAPFGKPCEYGGDQEPVFGRIRAFRQFTDIESELEEVPVWRWRGAEAQEFVEMLLQLEPSLRPTAREALEHQWLDDQRPDSQGLTPEMIQSMVSYARASPLERWCLLLVSVRSDLQELETLGDAFMHLDIDLDGRLSKSELADGIYGGARCWAAPDIDASEIFHAADLYQCGGLSFSEFVAACSYNQYRPLQLLADAAFSTLDSDRDGFVHMKEIQPICRECDMRFLVNLPQTRPFTAEDWSRCIVSSCRRSRHAVVDEDLASCAPLNVQRTCQEYPSSESNLFVSLFETIFGCRANSVCAPTSAEEEEESGAPYAGGRIFALDPNQEESIGAFTRSHV